MVCCVILKRTYGTWSWTIKTNLITLGGPEFFKLLVLVFRWDTNPTFAGRREGPVISQISRCACHYSLLLLLSFIFGFCFCPTKFAIIRLLFCCCFGFVFVCLLRRPLPTHRPIKLFVKKFEFFFLNLKFEEESLLTYLLFLL